MKLAVVGHALLHQRQWRLFDEIASRGIETHLFMPVRWPDIAQAEHPPEDADFTPHYHDVVRAGDQEHFLLKGLFQSIKEEEPDVVLTQDEPWNLIVLEDELICRVLGVPHAIFTWENLNRVPVFVGRRLLGRLSLSLVSGVVAGNEKAAKRVRDRGFSGPLTVSPQSGIDTQLFRPEADSFDVFEAFDIPRDVPLVLFAGRFVRLKGVDLVLETVSEVLSEHPETHYLLVGDGPESDRLVATCESAEYDQVSVVDSFQPYSRMPSIMSAATVFLHPARTVERWAEQFGFAVAEAMAAATPVVASDCGSLPYVIGASGILCPEGDAAAFAEAVSGLLRDGDRRATLARSARNRVKRLFSIDTVATDQIDFLSKM